MDCPNSNTRTQCPRRPVDWSDSWPIPWMPRWVQSFLLESWQRWKCGAADDQRVRTVSAAPKYDPLRPLPRLQDLAWATRSDTLLRARSRPSTAHRESNRVWAWTGPKPSSSSNRDERRGALDKDCHGMSLPCACHPLTGRLYAFTVPSRQLTASPATAGTGLPADADRACPVLRRRYAAG